MPKRLKYFLKFSLIFMSTGNRGSIGKVNSTKIRTFAKCSKSIPGKSNLATLSSVGKNVRKSQKWLRYFCFELKVESLISVSTIVAVNF